MIKIQIIALFLLIVATPLISQQILTNLNIGIIVIDQNKNILHVNPEIFKILELETLKIKNKNVIEIVRSEQFLNAID